MPHHITGPRGARDGRAVGLPLPADRTEAIGIGEGVGGGEGLAQARHTADRHTAGGCLVEVIHQQHHLVHRQAVVLAVINGVSELQGAQIGRVVAGGVGIERPAAIAVGAEPVALIAGEPADGQRVVVGIADPRDQLSRAEGEEVAGDHGGQLGTGKAGGPLVDRQAQAAERHPVRQGIPVGEEIHPFMLDALGIRCPEQRRGAFDVAGAIDDLLEGLGIGGLVRQVEGGGIERENRAQIGCFGEIKTAAARGLVQQRQRHLHTTLIIIERADHLHLHLQLGQRQRHGRVTHAAGKDLEGVGAQQVRRCRRHLQSRTDLLRGSGGRFPQLHRTLQQGGDGGVHVGHRWPLDRHQRHRQIPIAGRKHEHTIGYRQLGRSLGIGVDRLHPEGDADVRSLHHITGSRGTGDRGAIRRPLVEDRPGAAGQPVGIHHGGLQGLADGRQPGDHHRPRKVGGGWWRRRHHRGKTSRGEAEQAIAEPHLLHAHQQIHPLALGGAIDRVLVGERVIAEAIGAAAPPIDGCIEIRAAIEQVVAAVALEIVIAGAAKHLVVAGASHDDVVAATGIDGVVAGLEVEVFVFAAARAAVIAGGAAAGIGHHA